MAKKCARTFSIVVEKGKKSILEVRHLLPDALPRSVRAVARSRSRSSAETRAVGLRLVALPRCAYHRRSPPPDGPPTTAGWRIRR